MADTEKYRTFQKGQAVYREGQQTGTAFMLKTGRVVLSRVARNRRVVLGRVVPGQIFGIEGLSGKEARQAGAEAEETSEIIAIDRATFQTMLIKCPGPVKRLTDDLLRQVGELQASVAERPAGNLFLGVCAVIDLAWRVHANLPESARGQGWAKGLSLAELSRTVKDILPVTQLEIDEIVARLARLKLIAVSEETRAKMAVDALGRSRKQADFLQDRTLRLADPEKFLTLARGLHKETREEAPPFADGLEFVDIHDFAALAGSTPEMIYRKLAYKEIPENLCFWHRPSAAKWAAEMGPEFFKRVKRRRVSAEDLAGVDDVAYVDNATLQEAFERVGLHRLAMLLSVAGEEARRKILANLSAKMAKVVAEEARDMEAPDDLEVADAEEELIRVIKELKGIKG
jgi:CRP-like cAMP-binding protein